MNENIYRINISSPPDREKLVAEIIFDNVQWAEVNQETSVLKVEFYSRPDEEPWCMSLDTALKALNEAKGKLSRA